MTHRFPRFSLAAGLLFFMPLPAWAQAHRLAQPPAVSELALTHFDLQSSEVVTASGDSLSTPGYPVRNYWFPVTVPCTVLSGLVQNHVYPDPYQGMNNMYIPDASDSFNLQYHLDQYSFLPGVPNPWKKPYWYRTSFRVPAADKGKHFELVFKGINYRAEVWLNGAEIADSAQMAGMFAEYHLDVSRAVRVGAENVLAVRIFPLDFPGLPSHPQLKALGDFFLNGGPTGDIGKNVTMLCSIGWDWIPEVHDRNIGIWQPVYLRTSGQVVISRPHVVTELPRLPDTSVARIRLGLTLTNYGAAPAKGELLVQIVSETFATNARPVAEFRLPVSLGSGETEDLGTGAADALAGAVMPLTLQHPHLWWPNGYGRPDLYRMRLRVTVAGAVSDDTSFLVGIRTVGSKTTNVNGWVRRDFYVNGRRIHLVGGAWVPDMMLNRDSVRYDYELHLCRNANVNLIRIWGGGIAEPDDFYTLADRYGELVWQDFWVTGDTQGEFKGSPNWPLEGSVFVRNMVSTILRIRNHPSLLVWTGGNEGHAREELYNAMRDSVAGLDGTRPFIPSSSGFAKQSKEWKGSWPDDQPSGVYSGGPYSFQEDTRYYQLVDAGKDWVFKDETGLPSQPPYNTLSRIITDLVPDSSLPFPLNNVWGYHDACQGAARFSQYYQAMATRFGSPVSVRDYCRKMQLLNATGYRGIFEAAGHRLRETGGVMLWKLNSAFPSVVWQIYDWYLEPNAGYYFMKRACEPLHVQLNLDDSAVAVVNRTYKPRAGLEVHTKLVGIDGEVLFSDVRKVSVDSADATEVLPLAGALRGAAGISFVLLELRDAGGAVVSRNVYWMSPGRDFRGLQDMPQAALTATLLGKERKGTETVYTFRVYNPTGRLGFFVNAQLWSNGQEVLPSFWSDNYFSLEPHTSTTVTVGAPTSMLLKPELVLDGWNSVRFVQAVR